MISLSSILLIGMIVFAATFVRSSLGFGDALIAMPLLVFTIGIPIATPLVAFISATLAFSMMIGRQHYVEWKAVPRLLGASAAGIPVGLLLLRGLAPEVVQAILGSVLVIFALYKLTNRQLPQAQRPELAYIFGFMSGMLGGAYNTGGPPVIIYAALRRWSPEQFRATLQYYFFPTSLFIIAGHGLGGLWTPTVFQLYALMLPIIGTAFFLGRRLGALLPRRQFELSVHLFLLAMGVMLII